MMRHIPGLPVDVPDGRLVEWMRDTGAFGRAPVGERELRIARSAWEVTPMASFDLHAWFHSLEPTDQWLIEWRTQHDLSIKEIAARSGLSQSAVAERLARLRERLVNEAWGTPPQA